VPPFPLRVLQTAAVTAVLVLAASAPASAGEGGSDPTTTTAVTSPADPTFGYVDDDAARAFDRRGGGNPADQNDNGIEDVNELVVSGTADGNSDLDLRCFYGSSGGGGRTDAYVDDVESGTEPDDFEPAGDGTWRWSTVIDKDDLVVDANETVGDQACRLRALPDSADESGDLSPFSGPAVGFGFAGTESTSADEDTAARSRTGKRARGLAPRRNTEPGDGERTRDFAASFPQLRGYFSYYSLGSCGICYAAPFTAGTFAQPTAADWESGPALWEDTSLFDDRNGLLIDGRNAFTAYSAPEGQYDDGPDLDTDNEYEDLDGQPELTFAVESFDPRTGNVTFVERQDLVHCQSDEAGEPYQNDDDIGPSGSGTCDVLVPAGVRHERRVVQGQDGRLSSVTDTFTSTDGEAHDYDADYYSYADSDHARSWKIPGADEYAMYADDDPEEIDLPPSQVGTFVGYDSEYRDSADDTAAPVSLTYTKRPSRAGFDRSGYELYLQYVGQIPAGGSDSTGTLHYGHAMDVAGAEALGAGVEDRVGGGPAVDLVSPSDGATTDQPRVTVSGTASDNVGVSLLKVNGRSVPVQSDGSWSTELDLAEGANRITAEAVDGQGQGATDAITVTYRKPAAPAPQVIVQQQPPPPQPQPSRTLVGTGRSAVRLVSSRVRLRGDEFVLRIRCAPGPAQNGTMRVRGRFAGAQRNLGTESYQCPGGGTRSVDFDLSRREERLLRRTKRRTLRFTVYIVGRDLTGEAGTFRQTLTLVLRSARRR